MADLLLEIPVTGSDTTVDCPHCHRVFGASVDPDQPPRLQGAKCPHCRLFVPIHCIVADEPSR